MESLAPICLFVYNRIPQALKTLHALRNNNLAEQSILYIFSDGPKDQDGANKIMKLRKQLREVDGFRSVKITESESNKGLSKSIIDGVTTVLEKHGKVIVLEDDLITSPNFLDFMNQALDSYSDNSKIFSVSGYTMNLKGLRNYPKDFYTAYRASSWGWGTWDDRWNKVDWEVKSYSSFIKNPLKQFRFTRGGSDMPGMLRDQMNGRIDSWAIRWCYEQFNRDLFAIFPAKSKIISIGFGPDATHTKKTKRFFTVPDESNNRVFKFDSSIVPDKKLMRQFRGKFSIISRLKDKFI